MLKQLAQETEGYTQTKSSLHFPIDEPLPAELVQRLLAVRIKQAFPGR